MTLPHPQTDTDSVQYHSYCVPNHYGIILGIQYLSYGKVRENDRVVSWHLDERGYPTRIQGCIHNRYTNGKETLLKVCYNHSDVSYSLSYQLLEMVYLQNPIESPECTIPYSGKTEER